MISLLSLSYKSEDLIDTFIAFKNSLQKKYENMAEMEYRFKVFRTNYVKMYKESVKKKGFFKTLFGMDDTEEEELPQKSYKVEMNKFADMTDKEFNKYYVLDDNVFDEKTESQQQVPVKRMGLITDDKLIFKKPRKLSYFDRATNYISDKAKSVGNYFSEIWDDFKDLVFSSEEDEQEKKQKNKENEKSEEEEMQIDQKEKKVKVQQKQIEEKQEDLKKIEQKKQDLKQEKQQEQKEEIKKDNQKIENQKEQQKINQYIDPNIKRKINWKEQGYLNQVANQSKCDSCYIFATIDAVAAHYKIKYGEQVILSAQEIIDCSRENFECKGGQPSAVLKYIVENDIAFEQNYPYEAKKQKCLYHRLQHEWINNINPFSYRKFTPLQSYYFIKPNIVDLIKALHYGPVVVAHHVNDNLKFYKEGIFDGTGCEDKKANHASLAVGYDLDAEIPYIELRNAWGQDWGEKGYYRIAMGQFNKENKGLCQLAGTEFMVMPKIEQLNFFNYIHTLKQSLTIDIVVINISNTSSANPLALLFLQSFILRLIVLNIGKALSKQILYFQI